MPLTKEVIVSLVAILEVSATTVLQIPDDAVELSIRYPVIATPPLLTGAVQLKRTLAFPAVAVRESGALETVRGVTFEPLLSGLLPNEFIATTFTV